jgi:hypothetical protein
MTKLPMKYLLSTVIAELAASRGLPRITPFKNGCCTLEHWHGLIEIG